MPKQIDGKDGEETLVEKIEGTPKAAELLGAAVGLIRAADSNSRTDEGTFDLLLWGLSALKRFAAAAETESADAMQNEMQCLIEKIHAEKFRLVPDCSNCAAPCGRTDDWNVQHLENAPQDIRAAKNALADSLLKISDCRQPCGENTRMCIARGVFMLGEDCTAAELIEAANAVDKAAAARP